jgi:alpha-beta hydrolase superfamily lysophospholipase
MQEERFTIKADDGVEIVCFKWASATQNEPKAIVQLIHGSVEHIARYKPLAEELVKNGYLVYGSDQRGHGETAGSVENLSYFSDMDNGWEMSRDELHDLTKKIKDENPGKKVFLFGHSMGSFLLRDYITQYGNEIDGTILSGTGGGKAALLKVVTVLTRIMIFFRGRKSFSPLMHNIIYGALNNEMKNPRTDSDFLSRDESEVDKYINDPYCGSTVTLNYALEMVCGLGRIQKKTIL